MRPPLVAAAVLVGSLALAACGGGTSAVTTTPSAPSTTDPTSAAVHSYLSESADDVLWVQLTDGDHPTGIFEKLLAPSVAPGGTTVDWVYRIAGTIVGHTLTYTLTSISTGATPITGTQTSPVTEASMTLGPPLALAAGTVLSAATQHQYDLAARGHVLAWGGHTG